MLKSELEELIALKLKGDNKEFTLSPLIYKEALHDVLRRTAPASYIEDTKFDKDYKIVSKYFRRLSSTKHLRLPDLTLEPIDMDEELCMALMYFICEYGTNKEKNKSTYKNKAKEICSIYDTNNIETNTLEIEDKNIV